MCKYHSRYGFCKYGDSCKYKHTIANEIVVQKTKLTSELDVDEIQTKIKELDIIIRKYEDSLKTLENDVKEVKQLYQSNLSVSNAHVQDKEFTDRIIHLESSFTELTTSVKDIGDNNYILIHAVDDLERTSKLIYRHLGVHDESIRCEYCRQEFELINQLREHVEQLHHTTLD